MSSQLITYLKNTQGTDYAVGDIHGCFTLLQAALDKIGFNPECDRLFSVGDLVDRGPESAKVLTWLEKPWFFAVCGNHDFMTWRSAIGNPYPYVNHLKYGGEWLLTCNPTYTANLAKRLQALPIVIEVHTAQGLVGLIHAGCPHDNWHDLQRSATKGFSEYEINTCLWSIERHTKKCTQPINNIRAVIHGHMTVPAMQKMGNVYYIDTGGWLPKRGSFTFLNLNTLQPKVIPSTA